MWSNKQFHSMLNMRRTLINGDFELEISKLCIPYTETANNLNFPRPFMFLVPDTKKTAKRHKLIDYILTVIQLQLIKFIQVTNVNEVSVVTVGLV